MQSIMTAPPEQDLFLVGKYRKVGRAFLEGDQPAILEVPNLRDVDVALSRSMFCRFEEELPKTVQARWGFKVPRDPHYDEADDGAIRKEGKEWKLYFHYRPDTEALLARERSISLLPWQQEWFIRMNRIWNACTDAHLALADRLDHLLPGAFVL